MATPNNKPEQDGAEEKTPPLKCIGPSIFVPTDRDFTKTPPPLSDDPVTRTEAAIESLDWHAARVEENMISMLLREAQRVRRAGLVERVQYDAHHRPVAEQRPPKGVENDMRLEELFLCDTDGDVARMLKDEYGRRDSEGGAGAVSGNVAIREDPRDNSRRPHHQQQQQQQQHHHHHHSPPPPRHRGPRHPEYMDLATIRREKMFRMEVDELRHTPRSAALVHVLNLVKWGWDEQLEGHRTAVRKETEQRRANLHRQVKENPPLATVGASSSSMSAPPVPAPLHGDSGDAMDLD